MALGSHWLHSNSLRDLKGCLNWREIAGNVWQPNSSWGAFEVGETPEAVLVNPRPIQIPEKKCLVMQSSLALCLITSRHSTNNQCEKTSSNEQWIQASRFVNFSKQKLKEVFIQRKIKRRLFFYFKLSTHLKSAMEKISNNFNAKLEAKKNTNFNLILIIISISKHSFGIWVEVMP